MRPQRRRVLWALGLVSGVVAAAVWLQGLTMGPGDDRPPIVVRSGSMIFENGTKDAPGTPWADRDTFLHEYKPKERGSGPDFKGVKEFEVTIMGAYAPLTTKCSSALTGQEVRIEFTQVDGTTVQMKIRRRNFAVFGRAEPKVDPQGPELTPDNSATPPSLTFKKDGYISRVSVDNVDCSFSPAATLDDQKKLYINIQPKAE